MKTPFNRPVIAAVVAALCIAPGAFAKHPKDNAQKQGAPGGAGAPGGPGGQDISQGKQKKHGKSGAQGSGGAGFQGPGVPVMPGVRVFVAPPPMPPPPPPPYYRRSYQRSSSYVGDSTVASVQRVLKQRGYYSGPVDGDAGSGTRAGIRGFREDNGMAPTSAIDGPLLRALGL